MTVVIFSILWNSRPQFDSGFYRTGIPFGHFLLLVESISKALAPVYQTGSPRNKKEKHRCTSVFFFFKFIFYLSINFLILALNSFGEVVATVFINSLYGVRSAAARAAS